MLRNILFVYVFVVNFCFLFCVLVLFCVLFLLLCCLFPIFIQVYRPLPQGGNPVAVNKWHIRYQKVLQFAVTAPTKVEVVTWQRIPPVNTYAHENNAGMTWRDIKETIQNVPRISPNWRRCGRHTTQLLASGNLRWWHCSHFRLVTTWWFHLVSMPWTSAFTRRTTTDLFAQLCSGLTSVATNRSTEGGIIYIGPLYKMATLTRHTINHLAAQLCFGLTSVAINRDTESGGDYMGPLFKMATLTRHTTNHLVAQLCSGLTSVATYCDT